MYNYKDIIPKHTTVGNIGYDEVFDELAVQESLKNLFIINQGEVPGKPQIGNPLNIFLFDNIGYFEVQGIKTAFINMMEKYEPRVKIVDLDIKEESEYNNISISITYIIMIGDRNTVRNYRFSIGYNTMTNLTLRKDING